MWKQYLHRCGNIVSVGVATVPQLLRSKYHHNRVSLIGKCSVTKWSSWNTITMLTSNSETQTKVTRDTYYSISDSTTYKVPLFVPKHNTQLYHRGTTFDIDNNLSPLLTTVTLGVLLKSKPVNSQTLSSDLFLRARTVLRKIVLYPIYTATGVEPV